MTLADLKVMMFGGAGRWWGWRERDSELGYHLFIVSELFSIKRLLIVPFQRVV